MPNLSSLRGRVRSLSLVTLFAYLGVLVLIAFGHRCVSADPGAAQGECRKAASSPVVETARAMWTGEHSCPACAFIQQTTAIATPRASLHTPVLRVVRAELPPALHVPRSCPTPHTSRGPPLS